MIFSAKIADVTQRPDERGRCYIGLETALAIAGTVATVASTGMSIAGASQQSEAQRQAGEIAYQNALARNEQMKAEAKRMEDKANSEAAASQREAIERNRQAEILASRAQAVMAGSGAGVDEGVIAGILGEGQYGFDVAIAEGRQREQDSRYDAALRRWEGETGVISGGAARDARRRQADVTMTSGLVSAGLGLGKELGGSLASRYGNGPAPGSGIDSEISDWSRMGQDAASRAALNRVTTFGPEFDL